MKFYKDKSNPLEKVSWSNMENDHIYITEEGDRVVYKEYPNGEVSMPVIQQSALNIGEYVEDLTPKQLKLYWIIMENKKEGKIG